MSVNPVLRNAMYGDLPAILEIYNDAILHTTSVYHYAPHTLEMRQQWWNEKQEKNHPVIIAEKEGAVVGFATYGTFRIWPAYKYSVEHSLYVHPDHKGKGIGKLLLEAIIHAARQADYHTLIAGIDAANEASLRLHRQFGFTEAGSFKEVGYKFDRWLDLVFMQLILDTPLHPQNP
jgi:phosphinothricin acetyltransferase